MATYVKFELDDGTVVYIETTEAPRGSSGLIPSGHNEQPSSVSFQKSIEAVRKMAQVMVEELRGGLDEQPDELQVNFGLKANGDVGSLVIARGGMESNYNIMLRWRSNEKKDEESTGAGEPARAEKEKKAE